MYKQRYKYINKDNLVERIKEQIESGKPFTPYEYMSLRYACCEEISKLSFRNLKKHRRKALQRCIQLMDDWYKRNVETDKSIYSVCYFNPIGNCDNVVHVEANGEFDAALIAHMDGWVPEKECDISDYNVSTYSPEYVITKNDIFKRRQGQCWTKEKYKELKEKTLKKWLQDEWKYGYNRMENGFKELQDSYFRKVGSKISDKELKDILGIK